MSLPPILRYPPKGKEDVGSLRSLERGKPWFDERLMLYGLLSFECGERFFASFGMPGQMGEKIGTI